MKPKITTAMILCAGLGTRMQPLTLNCPKPLLDLAGKPILAHILAQLMALGLRRFVINAHYKARQIEAWVERQQHLHADCTFHVSDESEALLDSGGGIVKALPKIGDERFLVVNGDSFLFNRSADLLWPLLRDGLAAREGRLGLVRLDQALGYEGKGDFEFDPKDQRIRRFVQGTERPYIFCGYALYHRDFFAQAPDGAFPLGRLFDQAMEEKALRGCPLDATFLHIGRPASLEAATDFLRLKSGKAET